MLNYLCYAKRVSYYCSRSGSVVLHPKLLISMQSKSQLHSSLKYWYANKPKPSTNKKKTQQTPKNTSPNSDKNSSYLSLSELQEMKTKDLRFFNVIILLSSFALFSSFLKQKFLQAMLYIIVQPQATENCIKYQLPTWEFVDAEGGKTNSKKFKKSFYFIVFGYTNSSIEEENMLLKLNKIRLRFPKEGLLDLQNFKFVFVSLDPRRDTPQRLKQYLKKIDSSILGLSTKSSDDYFLTTLKSIFNIYTTEGSCSADGLSYRINHTPLAYFIGPGNQLLEFINPYSSDDVNYSKVKQSVEHFMRRQKQLVHIKFQ